MKCEEVVCTFGRLSGGWPLATPFSSTSGRSPCSRNGLSARVWWVDGWRYGAAVEGELRGVWPASHGRGFCCASSVRVRGEATPGDREDTHQRQTGVLLPGWLPNFLGTELHSTYEGTSGKSTSLVLSSCRVPNICRVECAAWRATLASCQCILYPIQCACRSCHPLLQRDPRTHLPSARPPLFREGTHPSLTPELKQNRRSVILSVLFQEKDTSLVHYGDPPTPTRVRDVSDGGRHNRTPSAATGMAGATLPVQPQVRGYLGPPCSCRFGPGLGNWVCVLFASFSDFSGAWFIIYPGPSLRAPSTSPLILSLPPSTFTTLIPISLHPFLLS